jgi:hypothetical protein
MLKLLRSSVVVLVGLLVLLGSPVWASAASSSTQNVPQSYGADTVLRIGMIVGFKKGDASKVEPLSSDNVKALQGVVIAANDAAISLSNGSSSTQVYVANYGRYNVLVSNQNGPIHIGDYISISSLNGIGMKAKDTEPIVLGKAAANFTGKGNGESRATVKNSDGSIVTVTIGMILVDITISGNPTQGHGLGDLPGFIQIASNSIAAKSVSAPRVYLSLAILLLTTVVAASILFSGVRSGIVSIGRNPLAKRYIIRGLLQVILASVIIFIIGLFAVYLLIKL